jgi:hypothetical protein
MFCSWRAMVSRFLSLSIVFNMKVSERFKKSADDVDKLINFDREIQQTAIQIVQSLHDKLRQSSSNEQMNGARALQMLRKIKENDSVREKYKAIFNQATVLLVSHFASALTDLFREGVNKQLDIGKNAALLDEELKITFSEIRDRGWNLRDSAADLLIAKYDYSFQDMGATVKAFQKYCSVVLSREINMNNVIAAQAFRHVIVHAGGRVSERTVRQVLNATPRMVKPDPSEGMEVEFNAEEITVIRESMLFIIAKIESSMPEPLA